MKKCWCGNEALVEYSEHYWKCEVCGTLVTKEDIIYDPENIQDDSDFYGKDYWEKKMVSMAHQKDMDDMIDYYLNERAVYWLKTLFKYLLPGSGSVAEVGCGLGPFSYLLKLSGYNETANDLSPAVCSFVKQTLKINIQCGSFRETVKTYDAITSFDVLEHFLDPLDFLCSARKSLKDAGFLLFQTPVYDETLSYEEMLAQKPRFRSLLCEKEHVYLFSRASVQRILAETGFPHVVFLDAFFGNEYDMFFLASSHPMPTFRKEDILEALDAQESGRLIRVFFKTVDQISSLGDAYDFLMNERENNQQKIACLTAECDSRQVQIKALEGECENRQIQIETLSHKCQAHQVRIDALTSECENRQMKIMTLADECENYQAQIGSLVEAIHTKEQLWRFEIRRTAIRVGIYAVSLFHGAIGETEQFIRNIVDKFCQRLDVTTFLFLDKNAASGFKVRENLTLIVIDPIEDLELQINNYIDLYCIGVWFCPMPYPHPLGHKLPCVTAVFDLSQDFYPEGNSNSPAAQKCSESIRKAIQNSDMFLTFSEYSKNALIDKYHIPAERIRMSYLDVDRLLGKPLDPQHLKNIQSVLPEEFILFFANQKTPKDYIPFLKGFALAREKQDIPLKIVFIGALGKEGEPVEQFIDANGLRPWVVQLGYVPQDDIPYIFYLANMLILPSFFEECRFPLLEAAVAQVPIICANVASLREIAGDAAVYFDENSPEEIAGAILRVYSDSVFRQMLIQNGIRYQTLFLWDTCTAETIACLQAIYVPRQKGISPLQEYPLVSIVTPSYNQGQFIRSTIESVLRQSYDNIEYIVVDGGSTDETVNILKSYGDRIRWVSETDTGQADAVNKGIHMAKGQIIGWLNSDDLYEPDAVEKVVQVFLSHPDVDMVYGEGVHIDADGELLGRYPTKVVDRAGLIEECPICQPTAFFTKKIASSVGMLNPDLQLCMDYELWMRIFKAGKVLYLPERLASSRMYPENKTLSRRAEMFEEACRSLKQHYGLVPHSWLISYASYLAESNPPAKRKYHYLSLFLRFNRFSLNGLVQGIKEFIRSKDAEKRKGIKAGIEHREKESRQTSPAKALGQSRSIEQGQAVHLSD